MGSCRGSSFRGYLDELGRGNREDISAAFDSIKKGNVGKLRALLRRYPGLLNQSLGQQITVLDAILLQMYSASSTRAVQNLADFLNEVIEKHKDKLDLVATDKVENTPLHFVFDFALHSINEERCKLFTDIGCRFLNLIRNSREFRMIMNRKNKSGVSVLRTFYLTNNEKARLSEAELPNLNYINQQVTQIISPPGANQIEFTKKSFKKQLEELLTDTITYAFMEDPYVSPEGHTYELSTWTKVNDVDPVTKTDNKGELQSNGTVLYFIGSYKKYFDVNAPDEEDAAKERALANEIQQYFDEIKIPGLAAAEEAIITHFVHDLTTKDIKNLLDAYQKHQIDLARQNANTGEPQPSRPFRTELPPPVEKPKRHIPENLYVGDLSSERNAQPAALPSGSDEENSPSEYHSEAPPPIDLVVEQIADAIDVNSPVEEEELQRDRVARMEEPAFENYSEWEADLSSEVVEPNQDIASIQMILDSIIANIKDKKQGRAAWFTSNTETKVDKLKSIQNWLGDRYLDAESKTIVLALIRDVCAIKRNKLGFFKPHSAIEFESWLENIELTCCTRVYFHNKALQQIDVPGNIDLLINDARNHLREPGNYFVGRP
jgi:hypothetical protein